MVDALHALTAPSVRWMMWVERMQALRAQGGKEPTVGDVQVCLDDGHLHDNFSALVYEFEYEFESCTTP